MRPTLDTPDAADVADRLGRPTLDTPDVAARLGTTEPHVRKLARERKLPHYRIGGRLKFDADQIDEWLRAAHVGAVVDAAPPLTDEQVGRLRGLLPAPAEGDTLAEPEAVARGAP